MIISDSYKLIFDALPKTGSTSVENYFKLLNLSDTEIKHGVIKNEYRKKWDDYTIFTVVRNPYERTVSWYLYNFKQMKSVYTDFPTELSFEEYLNIYGVWKHLNGEHLNPNCKFVKFENIETEIPKIAKSVGIHISNIPFPHLNETKKDKPWWEYYTPETITKVSTELHDEFDLFGYSHEFPFPVKNKIMNLKKNTEFKNLEYWILFDHIKNTGVPLKKIVKIKTRITVTHNIKLELPCIKFSVEGNNEEPEPDTNFLVSIYGFIPAELRPIELITFICKITNNLTVPVYICTDGSIRINLSGITSTGIYTTEPIKIIYYL